MSKQTEALKLALEALEDIGDEWGFTSKRTLPNRKKAIAALREALAEQPAQRKPLTDERTKALWEQSRCAIPRYQMFKSLIEADHGIKETT